MSHSSDASLPQVPLWDRFSVDPNRQPQFRASDTDRELVVTTINEAFEHGRLDPAERSERVDVALQAKTLGDLVPLITDIVTEPVRRSATDTARVIAVRSWVGLAVLFNVIWLATWIFAGIGPYYYWPIWPMIGTAIPVVMTYVVQQPGDRRMR